MRRIASGCRSVGWRYSEPTSTPVEAVPALGLPELCCVRISSNRGVWGRDADDADEDDEEEDELLCLERGAVSSLLRLDAGVSASCTEAERRRSA
jgi:hypothetical protein